MQVPSWSVALEGTGDARHQRYNPQERGERRRKAGGDGVQMAVAEEGRAVAKPGWQREGGQSPRTKTRKAEGAV